MPPKKVNNKPQWTYKDKTEFSDKIIKHAAEKN